MSYVTGSHAFKTGFNWAFGDYVLEYDINGDLVQLYRNGVPDSVRVYNTPIRANEYLNANLGMFVQDAWTLNRMTINMGVRFERFNGQIKDQSVGAGRFAPERTFIEVDRPAELVRRRAAPRRVVRPLRQRAHGAQGHASAATWPARRPGSRPATTRCSSRATPAPGAIPTATTSRRTARSAPSNNAAFGLPVQTIRPDPDIQREYDLEYTVAASARGHPRPVGERRLLSAAATHNQRLTQNLGWTPADYTIVNVVSPLDGTIIPVYNLDPAKRAQREPDRRQLDRLGPAPRAPTTAFRSGSTRGSVAPSSSAAGRSTASSTCAATRSRATQARYAGTAAIAANNFPQPDFHFCDQSQLDMPFLHEFKVAGSYTLPWWGVQANVAFQSYNGAPLFTRWNIAPTTRYAANCLGPCRPGELVVPNHDARDLYARSGRARPAVLPAPEPARHGLPQAVPVWPVSAVGAGRPLQHRQLVLREEPEHHRRHVARAAARHPPAADAAAGGAAALLTRRRPDHGLVPIQRDQVVTPLLVGYTVALMVAGRLHPLYRLLSSVAVAVILSASLAHGNGAPGSGYLHVSWTEKDGLPGSYIGSMAQDTDGYLWLIANGGLVRFDGVRFVEWAATSPDPLPDIRPSVLHAARAGGLWIGLAGDGGVARLFKGRVTLFETGRGGLFAGTVRAIVEDGQGELWAAGQAGVARYSGNRWEPVGGEQGLPSAPVYSLFKDRKGDLWVGTAVGVFHRAGGRFSLALPAIRAMGFADDVHGGMWMTGLDHPFRSGQQARRTLVARGTAPERIRRLGIAERQQGEYLGSDARCRRVAGIQRRESPSRHRAL